MSAEVFGILLAVCGALIAILIGYMLFKFAQWIWSLRFRL
jgi:hypothetical protein